MTDFLPRFAAAMALGACLLTATPPANADAPYPARPLRMVVPYAAGGPTDTFARALAESWARQLGVAVLVDNRSGAGTVVGTEVVAKAVPDGYTMLMTTVAHAANQRIYAKLPYRTVEDFAAVGLAARAPLVVLVNKSVPAATLPDFIAYLRTRPGKVNYGSAGVGSAPHLAAELLNHMAGTYAVHVPYRGSAPALADLIGGHVEFMLDSTASGLAQVRSGSVRLLATSMSRRLPQTPDTPPAGGGGACPRGQTRPQGRRRCPGTRPIPGTACSCRPQRPRRSSASCRIRWAVRCRIRHSKARPMGLA